MEKLREEALALGAVDLRRSTRKFKKYAVYHNGQWIHFGDSRYEDFTVHNDPERRRLYRLRASKIRDSSGDLTYKKRSSPNFWAYHLLW